MAGALVVAGRDLGQLVKWSAAPKCVIFTPIRYRWSNDRSRVRPATQRCCTYQNSTTTCARCRCNIRLPKQPCPAARSSCHQRMPCHAPVRLNHRCELRLAAAWLQVGHYRSISSTFISCHRSRMLRNWPVRQVKQPLRNAVSCARRSIWILCVRHPLTASAHPAGRASSPARRSRRNCRSTRAPRPREPCRP